jgi:chaperonin cofactor prefoldin
MEKEKQREHLLEKLDEVDRDLQNLNHKRYELEQRQKYLLKKINELDGYIEDNVFTLEKFVGDIIEMK